MTGLSPVAEVASRLATTREQARRANTNAALSTCEHHLLQARRELRGPERLQAMVTAIEVAAERIERLR